MMEIGCSIEWTDIQRENGHDVCVVGTFSAGRKESLSDCRGSSALLG